MRHIRMNPDKLIVKTDQHKGEQQQGHSFRRYEMAKGIQLKRICGQFFLIADRTMQDICPVIFPMDDVGAMILQVLGECRTAEGNTRQIPPSVVLLDRIVQRICAAYEVDDEQARTDVLRFCQILESKGYLVCPEGAHE